MGLRAQERGKVSARGVKSDRIYIIGDAILFEIGVYQISLS
jgi:hypothetical protein